MAAAICWGGLSRLLPSPIRAGVHDETISATRARSAATAPATTSTTRPVIAIAFRLALHVVTHRFHGWWNRGYHRNPTVVIECLDVRPPVSNLGRDEPGIRPEQHKVVGGSESRDEE
jgi:hypothetical protein